MRNRKLKKFAANLISKMPTNDFRCFLYRIIFGYNIYKSKIGRGTVIVVDNLDLIECKIGRFNRLRGPINIMINKNASIASGNLIQGDAVEEYHSDIRNFIMEENTFIGPDHYIDVSASFILSKNSWIAGRGSQFWTHGAGIQESIFIGKNCYIGSAVRFKPGTSIGDNSLVALGSVITKKFNLKNVIIAGHPAKIIRENYNWKARKEIDS